MTVTGVLRPGLLAGRNAVVTGGGTGIGFAVARDLLALGANVVVAARGEDRLVDAVARLRAGCSTDVDSDGAPHIAHVRADIRDPDDVASLMRRAVAAFPTPRLDMLVNNGGGQFPSAAEAISEKGWDAVINTNLNGTFRMCREAFHVQGGLRDSGGSVVNVICTHANGFPGMAHTGAARAGVECLTKTLAVEWAEFGVRVNAVAPGVIYSASAEGNYGNRQKHPQNVFDQMLSSKAPAIPFRRLGTPQEVSNTICFLLGPGGSYVSGSTLTVDGGYSCAGAIGADMFLRPTVRPAREAFPPACGGEDLPDFCVADDNRLPVMAQADTSVDEVQAQIKALEAKLSHLRGKADVDN